MKSRSLTIEVLKFNYCDLASLQIFATLLDPAQLLRIFFCLKLMPLMCIEKGGSQAELENLLGKVKFSLIIDICSCSLLLLVVLRYLGELSHYDFMFQNETSNILIS